MERTKANNKTKNSSRNRLYEEYSRFDKNKKKSDKTIVKTGFVNRTIIQFCICAVVFLFAFLLKSSDSSFAISIKDNLSKSINATTSAQDVSVFFNSAKEKYSNIKDLAVSAFSNINSKKNQSNQTSATPNQTTTQNQATQTQQSSSTTSNTSNSQQKTSSGAKVEKTAAQMFITTNPDYISTVSFDSNLFNSDTKKEVVSITPKIVDTVSYQETDGNDKSELYDFDTGEKRIDLPTNVNNDNLILPFEMNSPLLGTITSDFGLRINPITKQKSFHYGVDIGGYTGEYIIAPADGIVEKVGSTGAYGNNFLINHSKGIKTFYGHCSKILVKVGQSVKAGQKIAQVGSTGWSTGPHLHFEIHKDGVILNPLNFFDFG